MQEKVLVGLGSNQGDKANFLRQALQKMQSLPGAHDFTCSSMWWTEPWGVEGQEVYLNAVVSFFTPETPLELLASLQQIEHDLGRARPYHWAPRTIDLDLLLYGNQVIQTPALTVPHPRMKERLFVLIPLEEIQPQLRFPDGECLEEVVRERIQQETLRGIVKSKEKWLE